MSALFIDALLGEAVLLSTAGASYAASCLASLLKFRRLPSYHTWAGKGVWVPVGIGIICLVAEFTPWIFRIAMACVTAANLEAICITLVLREGRVDVPTLWHALRIDRQSEP